MKRITFDGLFCDIAMCKAAHEDCPHGICSQRQTWERLKLLEDVLGDNYDLDRLRELVQADREGDILRRNTPMSIYPDDDSSVEACPTCGSGEYLYNDDGDICRYCGQCGQRLDWTNDFYDRICTRLEGGDRNG